MQEEKYWQAVLTRDTTCDGTFVYAVRSTGIYCNPSCPSRRPQRKHVLFFSQSAAAEQAGFRACQRCHPDEATLLATYHENGDIGGYRWGSQREQRLLAQEQQQMS